MLEEVRHPVILAALSNGDEGMLHALLSVLPVPSLGQIVTESELRHSPARRG